MQSLIQACGSLCNSLGKYGYVMGLDSRIIDLFVCNFDLSLFCMYPHLISGINIEGSIFSLGSEKPGMIRL